MLNMLRITRVSSFFLLALIAGLTFGLQNSQAQNFMDPYEPDSNTVLLMHFDGDFTNASNLGVEDGQAHGDSYGFVASDVGSNFNNMLYLDNSSPTDTTGVLVPDHDLLDLTGDWTIEAWVNILTFGETNDDWRWRPRFVIKPHASGVDRFNYNLLARGDFRSLRGNYRAHLDSIPDDFGWLDTDTSPGSFQAGEWYHLTFIRDASQHVTGLLIHDKQGNLLEFASRDYDPDYFSPPVTTEAPLNIGMTKMPDGSFQNAFVDGFIDEIRISNIIRNFDTPPIVSNVTRLDQVSSDSAAEITATAKSVAGSSIDQLTINYNTGDGWQTSTMTQVNDTLYEGTIPSQPSGTAVSYYVSGTSENGLSANAPNGVNAERGPYMNYSVNDEGQVLHLDFEDESMPPTNKGNTGADINWTVGGEPQIADEGADGTSHSMYLEGDSSHLSVGPDSWEADYNMETEAAHFKNDEFVLDFWLKTDSIPDFATRWVIKEGQDRGVYESWNNFNYQIWTTGNGNITPASYFSEPGDGFGEFSGNVTGLDSTLTPDEWYRVVYVVKSKDTMFSQLYDAANNLINTAGYGMDVRVYQGNGPFRIGAFTPGLEDGEPPLGVPDGPLYRGWIDEVKFYNYVPDSYKDSTWTSIDDKPVTLPKQVKLDQNYPNPFNPKTKISYTLPRSSDVMLKVYDVLGREVATLVDKEQKSGSYTVNFDGQSLSSGVYFYRLETDKTHKVRKMMLLK